MFWSNYVKLCEKEKKTPSGLAKIIGISSGAVTGWKKGKIPSEKSLNAIADYFGISKWELLSEKNTATDSDGNENNMNAERHAFVTGIFDQLSFENQIRAVNELQSLLQRQLTQDDHKESD